MSPETTTPPVTEEAEKAAPDPVRGVAKRRRRAVWSPGVILLVVAAFGFNMAGLGVVAYKLNSTHPETAAPGTATEADDATTTVRTSPGATRVEDLLTIALRLEDLGETESARRVRAAAQDLLLEREAEDGAFFMATHLLERGRPREARRALYRILARADQPGSRWGELAVKARFLIGRTYAMQAERTGAAGREEDS